MWSLEQLKFRPQGSLINAAQLECEAVHKARLH
jgi:hypothetical protein